MTKDEHRRRLNNCDAWFRTGEALFETAELIWSRVQPGFDQLLAHRERVAIEVGLSEDQLPDNSPAASPVPLVVLMKLQDYGNAYLLNAGYAVENLLKAIRVKRLRLAHPGKDVTFGGGQGHIPQSHSYEAMAGELKSPTVAELALLKRLATFVEWAGRYPITVEPKPADDLNLRVQQEDRERVRSFQQRLVAAYKALGT